MATKGGYQNRIEILQGTLDMLIRKVLQWGEQHGGACSERPIEDLQVPA
jgi:PadR family transcriptional regulator, regulatory protein PadR